MLIRFDFAERVEGANSLPAELGVAPEIAALEELFYPIESESEAPPTARSRPAPAGMTINETVYNNELNPVHAEVDASVEALGDADASDKPAASSALAFTGEHRRRLAEDLFEQTSSQHTNVLPL